VKVVELVVAGCLTLGGIRSLVVWVGSEFDARSAREQVLYSLYVTARVGVWFAFAGFFAGYALVDEPRRFAWYAMIPISVAAVQMLAGLALWRSSPDAPGTDASRDARKD